MVAERERPLTSCPETIPKKEVASSFPEVGVLDLDKIDAALRRGHSRKYRGKHRSDNKGRGIQALFRNLWMLRYHRVRKVK